MEQSASMLQDFVRELLETEGALVESIEPAGLEIFSPPHLQQTLRLPELGRLGFATELPKGAERFSLESDWLERLGQILGGRGHLLSQVIRPAAPAPANPERILEHTLTLHNAVYRLIKVTQAWTRYLIFTFRYTAVSDEKRDGILRFGLNLSQGSTIDGLLEPLVTAALTGEPTQPLQEKPSQEIVLPPLWPLAKLAGIFERALPARIRQTLAPFLAGMQRRLERDLARIYDYYNGLREESLSRMGKQPAEATRELARLEAIAREYQAKVADLEQKYSMKVDVEWVQTLEAIMPVARFELLIKRRKGERRFHLDWNPLMRKLEPPPCEYSYTWETGRLVCDEALHLVSQAAHAPCPGCGKPYCRACHQLKCPKCGNKPC